MILCFLCSLLLIHLPFQVYGFAFILGFTSWHAANRPRTLVSWMVAAAAAIAMFKMTEVALYPDIT